MKLNEKIEKIFEAAEKVINAISKIKKKGEGIIEERKREHEEITSLKREIISKFSVNDLTAIVIANRIYHFPNYRRSAKKVFDPWTGYFEDKIGLNFYNDVEQRKFAKNIVFHLLEQNLEFGIVCCKTNKYVFAELISNYPVYSKKLRGINLYKWMLEGLKIAKENKHAGIKYFSLESKISEKNLEKYSDTVKVPDFASAINLYLRGRIGRNVPLKINEKMPPGFEEFENKVFTDGKNVYMPRELNDFPDKQLNQKWLWRLVTHEAGHNVEGTFDIDTKKLEELKAYVKEKLEENTKKPENEGKRT